MKRRILHGLVAGLLALAAAPATAVLCAIDQVPAATLLVPFFEVDLDNFSGVTTVVAITNTASTAHVAHVTLWTDWGIGVFAFDVYLTGHDVQVINLRDLFNGFIPRTASRGQDPADIVSPQGPRSDDDNFASCAGILPPPNLPQSITDHLRASLTGGPSAMLGGKCSGSARGDSVAHGYVTVDVVNGCTLRLATDVGYFETDTSMANVLTGDMMVVSPAAGTLFSYPVVHLEAGALPPGSRSFYGRYVGDSGLDGREPLPSTYAVRYLGPAPAADSELLVWRESPIGSPATCGNSPAWAPLPTPAVMLLDEATQTTYAAASLPFAAGVLGLHAGLANPFDRGLAILRLDHGRFAGRPAQGFVLARSSQGALDHSVEALQLEDNCTGARFPFIFADGFEAGLSVWSWATP
ncbi:MAG TPA: hypothetical protein VGV61_10805 [Thermoanaerobaculia bacterium]|jgi:hypothetical protein|nr:hypothetical protein [Thermoanaerobaculia bacterium]